MSIAYISLGSNLQDRAGNINESLHLLSNLGNIRINRKSSIYETEPVGGPPQGYFLNQVIEIELNFTPEELISRLLAIEEKLGRRKGEKWGPRQIDLDLLLFDDLVLKKPDLEVPHPYLSKRRFILVPLAEINPELIHPLLKKKIKDILKDLKDKKEVRLFHREKQ